jgi:hypothetical protein
VVDKLSEVGAATQEHALRVELALSATVICVCVCVVVRVDGVQRSAVSSYVVWRVVRGYMCVTERKVTHTPP